MDLKCLVCVVESKSWDAMRQRDPTSTKLPPQPVMRAAITIAATNLSQNTLICYEHLTIGHQSPLAVPNGTRLPPISGN